MKHRKLDSLRLILTCDAPRHISYRTAFPMADAPTRDERNLRHMRAFYSTFTNWNALRSELSWTYYRSLLRVDEPAAREWYMNEAATQNWNTRCAHKDHTVVRYSVLHGNEQLFASKYKLILPSEEELRTELLREQLLIEEQAPQGPTPKPRKGGRQ